MANPPAEYLRQFFPPGISRTLLYYGKRDGVTGMESRLLRWEGWQFAELEPNPAISLTEALLGFKFPAQFGLLILDEPGQQVLLSSDFEQFRPSVIVVSEEADAEEGRGKYAYLAANGYRFAGVRQGYSVWLSREVHVPAAPTPPSFSQATGSLQPFANDQAMLVMIDQPATPLGTVVRRPWSGSLEIQGWAFDTASREVDSDILLLLLHAETGTAETIPATRCARPDVAAHFGDEALQFSGFRADISLEGRKPGHYSVTLLFVKSGAITGRADGILAIGPELTTYELTAREGLAIRFLSGAGIEIGALQRRLPVPPGCTVKYIDRMPIAELLAHYPELAGMALQQPDLIDDGELLKTIADLSQDFVIANHFFEHSRNPIQTLFNLARVIRTGGVLYMAVPDKRYTKDLPRTVTRYEVMKQAYVSGQREGLMELYREWAETWESTRGVPVSTKVSSLVERDYSIHYNVWDFESLIQFLLQAKADFGLPFALTSCVTSENEVILILTKTA